MFYSHFNTCC